MLLARCFENIAGILIVIIRFQPSTSSTELINHEMTSPQFHRWKLVLTVRQRHRAR